MLDNTDNLLHKLQDCQHFNLLCSLVCNESAYVVGGAVRDALVSSPVTDIDLIFPDDPTSTAKEFARKAGGCWFWLDQSRLQSRVVFNKDMQSPGYDFAPFRAPDLTSDLHDRDYTINAVAIQLSAMSLVDPCDGLKDLEQGTLRMISEGSLSNDPLRVIKGVRHATSLGLKIEPQTLKSMRDNACRLETVAVERIRQEIWKILADKNVDKGLWLLNEGEVDKELFGEEFAQGLHSLIASLPHYQERWSRLAELYPEITNWLEHEVEQGLSRRVLLLFTMLLQQVDRNLPWLIAEKWSLSRKAVSNIKSIASMTNATVVEFSSIARNRRALTWWSLRCGVEAKLLVLFLAVNDLSAKDFLNDAGTWLPIADEVEDQRLPDLVYGRWLSDHLGIEEGPEMSRALEQLRNAEISGEVCNEEEARNFLSQVYLDKD